MRHIAALLVILTVWACGPVSAAPVRAETRLEVDGAELYLMTRGERSDAPILLWLHGGPGGAERPLFRLFNAELERSFVVAYWDQRGAGRSFDPHADPKQLTIARHLADLDAVVDHLRRTHGRRQVVLIGHSWGSVLGLLYSQAHPEKVAAFVGVGQVTSERARQAAQYAFVEIEARRRGDAESLARLAQIGLPPFDARREIAVQRLVERFGGYFHEPPNLGWLVLRGVAGGHVRPWEIGRYIRGNDVSLAAMEAESLEIDLPRSAPSVAIPVIFMLGRHDRQADSRLAADYFAALAAPHKELIWFERSAHNVPFEEPAAFNAAVVAALRRAGVATQTIP
jgi:proline iminopeptidase